MTRSDAQDHLDLLARDVASPVPAGLLDTARSARRRRVRGRLAAGGAVAAVAVVALAVTLPGGGATTRRHEAAQAASTSAASTSAASTSATPTSAGPVAPAGTRWISQGGYMVAVPGEWARTTTRCIGAVQDEGPGFYYLEIDASYCYATGDEPPSVGLLTGKHVPFGASPLVCDPGCSRTVVTDQVVLRLKEIASEQDVSEIVDTLQPLPEGWVVDPATGRATPYDVSVPESRLVTDRDDVVGAWTVVRVDGGPVPPGAERGLDVAAAGRASLDLTYSDDANGYGVAIRVRTDGTLESGQMYGTAVMCPPPGCAPSGFGVMDATQLRLTPDDHLVLVGADGTALAVYERV
ncbi:META domain-containing protein [Nocardioides plantarum]|uniref:META domain-containing protein n=1 Tax=Nocardioides plantarum TaxID=29299 RepID=UPI00111D4E8A|nr:hypothetical protein [Nocardioides plantarum]